MSGASSRCSAVEHPLQTAARMHPLTFAMKRVFLRSVAINRIYTREHHLTPARFDMMVALWWGKNGTPQLLLRRQLGVRSPTVSRMLSSLQALGYLTREVYPPDRRQRWITLTPKGRALIDIAQGDLTFGPFGESVARALVSRDPDARAPTERALATARTLFTTIRQLASDTATLRYPSYLESGDRSPRYPVPYADDFPARKTAPPSAPPDPA